MLRVDPTLYFNQNLKYRSEIQKYCFKHPQIGSGPPNQIGYGEVTYVCTLKRLWKTNLSLPEFVYIFS